RARGVEVTLAHGPTCQAGRRGWSRSALGLQIDGLWPLAALVRFRLEGNAHSLIERAQARSLDGRHVNEHVVPAVVRLDEAKSLLGVEELHRPNLAHE